MPKPILPQGMTPETGVGVAAGRLLGAKLKEVQVYVQPAVAGDVEGLHDLRVAVKRLRETLRLFQRCLPTRARQRVLPLVEELNDGLGQARDRDVLVGHARELAGRAPQAAAVLEAAAGAWAAERQREAQAGGGDWQRLLGPERLLPRLRRLARDTRRQRGRLRRLPLDRFAYVAVTARLERVRQRLAEAQATREAAALHRLRIAVKRLKYTMEPFLPVLPALSPLYATVAEVQDDLGLAHDADVLQAALTDFLRTSPGRDPDGVAAALRAVEEWRAGLYAAARRSMESLGEESWRAALLDALD